MKYFKRLAEEQIGLALKAAGAVYIRGPKACGKTETALKFAKSEINLQEDGRARFLASVEPAEVLLGEAPRLIDEWQEVATIWNNVKTEVDRRKKKGQFILAGSSVLADTANLHSGAGRFLIIDMNTMTLSELGLSNEKVRLQKLLEGGEINATSGNLTLRKLAKQIVVGGWPENIGLDEKYATEMNKSYIDLLTSDDISRVASVKRDPAKAIKVLKSLAKNVATPVEIRTLAEDVDLNLIKEGELMVSRQTASSYLDDFRKVMILREQPAFNIHIRSSAELRKTPKRHLVDPSLAAAVLRLSSDVLFKDLNYFGFLFESLVFHDMSVYASLNDASVSHYRDSYGNEVDIIVEKGNGDFAAFEVKLGDKNLDEPARKLLDFAENVAMDKHKTLISLNIVTGIGNAYTRADGVNVLPLTTLGA
ncbi:MAG: DUF4143 domain-containing protein [Clostridiales Family XIII bacterium]|jgi:predicted AAA+ superfamily ATPase|nr:DUF4143 domain-containing protein [Clostridiales Family XIII bacterium]